MINKIYDPLGLAPPFLLRGQKNLMQKKLTWDEQVSAETIEEWEQWKNDLKLLENINFNRCFKSPKFWRLIDCSLHHFSGASQDGYGQVSYLRLVDEDDHINSSLVIRKSRVTLLKFVSVPKLEFTAAALSVKVFLLLKRELTIWKTENFIELLAWWHWDASEMKKRDWKLLWQTEPSSLEKTQIWISGDILKLRKIEQIIHHMV